MIDTVNMGIMANMIQPTSSSISTQMISKKDSDKDSSLNIDEMGVSNNIFSSYDSDASGLVSQSELTVAIENAMSEFGDTMPSKEDFQSILSSFGFDAQEVGTLAGVAPQGGMPPASGGGEMSSSEDEEYDALDTNQDGVVSIDELQAGYENSTDISAISENQQNALDNLSFLMNVLKSGNENETASIDLKEFDGLLKAINNQNNNSEINLYLQNTSTSLLTGYA